MRCLHTDPKRGRCTRPAHQTSGHRYSDVAGAQMLHHPPARAVDWPVGWIPLGVTGSGFEVTHGPDMATRVIDWIEARTGVRVLPWQREVLRHMYDKPGKGYSATHTVIDEALDGDPDADPPLRSLWTVAGTVAGAGLAAYALWRLARRLDRGRQ